MTEPAEARPENLSPAVVILADDLIWASRLADAVTAVGGVPTRVRRLEDLVAGLRPDGTPSVTRHVIVDLTARAYSGIVAVQAARAAGANVVAVGQHDDVPLRKAAIAAGAARVYTYRALFEDRPGILAAWLAR